MTSPETEYVNGNDVTQTSETELNNATGKAPRRPRKPRYKKGPRPSAEQQQEGAPESPQEEEEEIGHKVFVGNLPFNITEPELFEYFTQAGHVLNANIIKRWGRPLGYGFVTFENEEMAEKAVTMLNKTTCAERVINVETTKPRSELPPRSESQGARRGGRGQFRGRGGRQPRATRPTEGEETFEESNDAEVKIKVEGEQVAEGYTEGESSQRGRVRRNRPNRKRRAHPANGVPSEEAVVKTETPEGDDAEAPQPKPRVRKPRVRKPRPSNDEAPRERRPRRPRGPPSDTALFVANLPFNMNDTGLEELFKDFKISSAHVIGRKGSDRNKGFGFVELADHGEQQRVLDALEVSGPLNVDGRDLSVKVALEENHEDAEGMAEQQGRREPARIDSE